MEIFIQSYALLTVGGIICFALGSVMLIDSPEDIMVISTQLIIFATIFTALFFGMIIWFGIRAQARRKAPIASDMEGLKGIAITDISSTNKGKVHLNGEIWIAQSDDSIMKNDTVIVVKIIDFTLFVKKSF